MTRTNEQLRSELAQAKLDARRNAKMIEALERNAHPSPIVVAVALALYRYNVSPAERATKLYQHFDGACAEMEDLIYLVDLPDAFTAMAMPTAIVYVTHAVERYAEEAAERVRANSGSALARLARFMAPHLRGLDIDAFHEEQRGD